MAGVKGRSGRKGYAYHDVEARQVQEIISLSFQTILHYLKDPNYPINEKARLATEFMKRCIADKQEIKTQVITDEEQNIIDRYTGLGLSSENWLLLVGKSKSGVRWGVVKGNLLSPDFYNFFSII